MLKAICVGSLFFGSLWVLYNRSKEPKFCFDEYIVKTGSSENLFLNSHLGIFNMVSGELKISAANKIRNVKINDHVQKGKDVRYSFPKDPSCEFMSDYTLICNIDGLKIYLTIDTLIVEHK